MPSAYSKNVFKGQNILPNISTEIPPLKTAGFKWLGFKCEW